MTQQLRRQPAAEDGPHGPTTWYRAPSDGAQPGGISAITYSTHRQSTLRYRVSRARNRSDVGSVVSYRHRVTNSAVLDGLARSSAALGDLIDRIVVDQWTAPTPCTEWTVRDVVNHLAGMNLVFVAMFENSPMPERGAEPFGADPAEAYRRAAVALQTAAARPGILERTRVTPLGVATGTERLQWRIADLLTHGWDLVQATGVRAELPDDLAEQALTFVRAQLPSQPRSGRFADPQPIPDSAPAIERLAAFTGRPIPWRL